MGKREEHKETVKRWLTARSMRKCHATCTRWTVAVRLNLAIAAAASLKLLIIYESSGGLRELMSVLRLQ